MKRILGVLSGVGLAVATFVAAAQAADKEVTIGYQLVYNPWKVAIVDGAIEKATGYEINWKQFDSGAKVINAMASGDVQIAMAGSSPIAAGVSRGLPIELFWIVEDIASAEALVVRDGSGIVAPQDLKGKKLGVPFVSTTHFHTLFALEQFGIDPKDVRVLNMQPNNIAAAWERGDIDAAFIWDPALGRIKKTGKVLITSGQLSAWGKATFDGLVSDKEWAAANPEFMVNLVKAIAAADEAYRSNPAAWGPDSEPRQEDRRADRWRAEGRGRACSRSTTSRPSRRRPRPAGSAAAPRAARPARCSSPRSSSRPRRRSTPSCPTTARW